MRMTLTEFIQYLIYINIEHRKTKFRIRWKKTTDSDEPGAEWPGEGWSRAEWPGEGWPRAEWPGAERPGVEVPDPVRPGVEDEIQKDQIQKGRMTRFRKAEWPDAE